MKRIFYPFASLLLSVCLLGTLSSKAQTYHIVFPNAPPPVTSGTLDNNDNNGSHDEIETGVRFRVTQPGTVTGIRFYKGNGVANGHNGHLWKEDGTLLASVTISDGGTGWMEGVISQHITPADTFIASVMSLSGDYAIESTTWSGSTNRGTPPIIVIASDNDPNGNGIFRYASSPQQSLFPNQTFNGTNYWIDISLVLDFPLPVVLSEFRASTSNTDVLLSWKTQSETNTRGFEIERSNNGTDWYPVNFIQGAGQSTSTRNYNYTDKGLAPGLYYYQLKQTDFDGKSTLSSIVTATVGGKGSVSLFPNHPNPFSGISTIRYDLPKTQKIRISLVDMMGREVKVVMDNISEAGSHLVTLDAATLQRQIYLVKLQTDDGVILTQRILVE